MPPHNQQSTPVYYDTHPGRAEWIEEQPEYLEALERYERSKENLAAVKESLKARWDSEAA